MSLARRMKTFAQDTKNTNQNSPQMSPLLNHVLSAPVLYAVSFPPPRRKNGIWKPHVWLLIVLIFVAFVLFCMSYNSHPHDRFISKTFDPFVSERPLRSATLDGKHSSPNNLYGVVFDAGSTGSRVHVFELTRQQADPDGSYALTGELFKHVQPGLSSYADHPDMAAESLDPLLKAAMERIPNTVCPHTPVVVRATAGLRLLPASKADSILSAVRQKLSNSCLAKSSNAVSILDGNQEGLYLWISLNFMTNRLRSPIGTVSGPNALDRTVGTLDLGGGSTQITFAPKRIETLLHAPEGYATDVVSGRTVRNAEATQGKHVYSQSYLGLGLMSARYSMLHTLTKRLPVRFRQGNNLYSPCLPPNVSIPWSHAGRDWTISHLPLHEAKANFLENEFNDAVSSLQMSHPSPLLNICFTQALQVLRDPVDGDRSASVYPPSGFIVHRPQEILTHEFYAFSYVFDVATRVGLINSQSGQRVTIAEFRDATDQACHSENKEEPFLCMDLAYITALLHDGYGFPWNKTITLQKKVDSFEISWGLGALFAELAALKIA